MFDYHANNTDMNECIRAPVEESYGMRTDHNAYLKSTIFVLLNQRDELRETGLGKQTPFLTRWGTKNFKFCQTNFDLQKAMVNKDQLLEVCMIAIKHTFNRYPLQKTSKWGLWREAERKFDNSLPFEVEYSLQFLLSNLLI